MKAIILVNQGGGSAGNDARARVGQALRTAGIEGEVELVDGAQLADRAHAATVAGAELVIAAGGDGTMSAVAGALAGTPTTLGIIPLGTLNHLARDLGISFDLNEAAAVIAANRRRKIDVASVNDRIFVNNSSVGLYSLMVDSREAGERRWGWSKKRAIIPAALRTLARMHHYRLHLASGGRNATLETPLLFVGNNDYAVTFPAAGQRQSLDDGRLCVMVLRRTGRLGLLAVIARALIGHSRAQDMIRLDSSAELDVGSARTTLSVAIDGETVKLSPPLRYRILPRALTVIVPT